ncbi:DUF4738 domain-containing protein [Eisenibacter elegans]|uniref:DUF4738 domain-containing protein n=1 Tax=Eisenibacter elegans TaxID=997 RepID=UPI000428C670|nr:DUF4738 domain-containing protein [Eisenibacter elegans]
MNKLLLISSIFLMAQACGGEQTADNHTTPQNTNPQEVAIEQTPKTTTEKPQELPDLATQLQQPQAKEVASKETGRNVKALIAQLRKDASVELIFAEPDYGKTQTDSVFEGYEVRLTTSCLNDEGVLQEMYDMAGLAPKAYMVSHNYQTTVQIGHAGQEIVVRNIRKEDLQGQLMPRFVEDAILKHPELLGFNTRTKELQLAFIIGIPSTDLVVMVQVAVDMKGQVRVTAIENLMM